MSTTAPVNRIGLRKQGAGYLFSKAGGTTGSLPRDVAIKIARAYQRDRWLISPHRLDVRVDGIPLDRPIFLLGTQGASETIVGRCLRRNRAVVTVSGNSDRWTGADEMATIRNRMRRLPEPLWGSKHRFDITHPLIGTDQPYACDALLPLYRRTAADADRHNARSFRRLIREHLYVYAHDPRHARFLDKTHAYTVKMPLLAAILADASPVFVVVVRNPYETCRWAVERKPTLFREGVSRATRLALLAEHWANAYGTALADPETVPNVVLVRFEDFLSDPEAVVRSLCDVVAVDFQGSMVPGPNHRRPFATLPGDRKWYPLYRSNWLDGMTREERAIIAGRCGELAERFGYGPEGVTRAGEPVEILSTGWQGADRNVIANETPPAGPVVAGLRT